MDREDRRQPIDLAITPERVACSKHGEVFRETWPSHYVNFSLALWDEIQAGAHPFKGEALVIESSLDRHPLCERVTPATLIRLYIASKLGHTEACKLCGEVRPGVVYTVRLPTGDTKRFDHLCFECIVYRLEPAN